MTTLQQVLTILAAAAATVLTRSLPFAVFSSGDRTPHVVRYLGAALPPAVFGLLVVYCLRNVDVLSGAHGLPEFIAIAGTAALHLWRRGGATCSSPSSAARRSTWRWPACFSAERAGAAPPGWLDLYGDRTDLIQQRTIWHKHDGVCFPAADGHGRPIS